MTVPHWARWALAAILVVGVASAGVAANLAVLNRGTGDAPLGTLSARSIAPSATPMPAPERVDVPGRGDDDHGGRDRDDD